MVVATALDTVNKLVLPELVTKVAGTLTNGVPYTSSDAKSGLDALANQPVNIVVVAGKDSGSSTNFGVGAALLQHLDATETDGHERIGVLGADSDTPASITSGGVDAGHGGGRRGAPRAPTPASASPRLHGGEGQARPPGQGQPHQQGHPGRQRDQGYTPRRS
jgi:hypothetical protein